MLKLYEDAVRMSDDKPNRDGPPANAPLSKRPRSAGEDPRAVQPGQSAGSTSRVAPQVQPGKPVYGVGGGRPRTPIIIVPNSLTGGNACCSEISYPYKTDIRINYCMMMMCFCCLYSYILYDGYTYVFDIKFLYEHCFHNTVSVDVSVICA